MTVQTKICGLKDPVALQAALDGGADAIGLVFYARSPRAISPAAAGALVGGVADVMKVGLFVDPDDDLLDSTLEGVALDLVQLHGAETPARVAEIGARTGLPTMKAFKIRHVEDLGAVADYDSATSWLLFDAKAPDDARDALPGGNGITFDWRLLAGRDWQHPWMLSGGLDADNVAEAIRISGAPWVDVSSGVESAPGEKDPARITAFLNAVRAVQ
ncbi:MAG: phosphoribosylanthranilate isomerase [Minwuia sp.]|nr:phosphoribosylanthranilate isomerase [Minwuia sp.]